MLTPFFEGTSAPLSTRRVLDICLVCEANDCFSSLYSQFFLREDRVASWVTDLADNQFADLLQQVYGKVLYLSVEEVLLFLAERRGYSVMLLTTLAVVLRVMLPVCDPLLAIT